MAGETITGAKTGSNQLCVLILEDDQVLLASISAELTAKGYEVLTATGESGLAGLLAEPRFLLVILDLELDGAPYRGLELVRSIRNARNVPIIVISGHAKPWDRLRALEMGIDDYITKPFLFGEVLIRIERVLKTYDLLEQSPPGSGEILSFAGMSLDTVRRTLAAAEGGPIDLTETEFNILEILVNAAGCIVTRDDLWQSVRGQAWSPLDRALDVHVARLRSKLEPNADSPRIIKSARGIGYVLAASVTRSPAAPRA